MVLVTATYQGPAYDEILMPSRLCSDTLNHSAEIYRLGAEAYQSQIDEIPSSKLSNIANYLAKRHHSMGTQTISEAIHCQQKAIGEMKSK